MWFRCRSHAAIAALEKPRRLSGGVGSHALGEGLHNPNRQFRTDLLVPARPGRGRRLSPGLSDSEIRESFWCPNWRPGPQPPPCYRQYLLPPGRTVRLEMRSENS